MAQWCRLQEKDTKMEVVWLTVLGPRADRFEVGAVSGSMLYLTTFCPPISGAILGIDLTRPDEEPKVTVCFWKIQGLPRGCLQDLGDMVTTVCSAFVKSTLM